MIKSYELLRYLEIIENLEFKDANIKNIPKEELRRQIESLNDWDGASGITCPRKNRFSRFENEFIECKYCFAAIRYKPNGFPYNNIGEGKDECCLQLNGREYEDTGKRLYTIKQIKEALLFYGFDVDYIND